MIPKVRMFYVGLSTDFSTEAVENVSKELRGKTQARISADQKSLNRLRDMVKQSF
jgi:hypothetical protein